MSDKKISQLLSATVPLTGLEELPLVQGGVTKKATVDQISNPMGVKVFKALLTQSGGSTLSDIGSDDPQPLTIGVTYEIIQNDDVADFTNIGAPNNNVGTKFIATGTTPASWGELPGNVIIEYNEGAPVATVLVNTVGNVWFEYANTGSYLCKCIGVFNQVKTFPIIGSRDVNGSDSDGINRVSVNSTDDLILQTEDTAFSTANSNLIYTPFLVEIYP